MDIHAVQTDTHGAAQTGGTEGQLLEEAALDLLLVAADGLQLGFLFSGQGGAGQPLFISFKIGHW